MSPAVTTTPPATQAALLRRVLASQHPKLELGTIAHHFALTMNELQAILRANGYPERDRMRVAAADLEEKAAIAAQGALDDIRTELVGPTEPEPSGHNEAMVTVKLNDLRPDPDNPREKLEGIEELADSIKSMGLLQPIVARRDGKRLTVVAGHRRLAALQLLKHTETQVIVRSEMRPDYVLAAMLIENGQRAGLDPIEEARALSKIQHDRGIETHTELAAMIGRSITHVSSRIALLNLSADEQAQVRSGEMKLIEATHRGRSNGGTIRPGAQGANRGWHLGPQHDLGLKAKARCKSEGHSGGRTVGGMACGECWEAVIRADERRALITASHEGSCPTCGGI